MSGPRAVAGACGRVNVDELPRGIANELNEFGRRALAAGMRLLGVFGIAGGAPEAKRAFEAMMTMKKIDIVAIEAARQG